MSAPGRMTGEIETRRGTAIVIGNLIALLSLLVLGYPLAPATIRTMLLGWILMAVAIMQFICGYLQMRQSSVTLRPHPYTRPPESGKIVLGTLRGRR